MMRDADSTPGRALRDAGISFRKTWMAGSEDDGVADVHRL
jgi:hypothetical protein